MPQQAAYRVVFLFFSPKSKVGLGEPQPSPSGGRSPRPPQPITPRPGVPAPAERHRGPSEQPHTKQARGDGSGFGSHRGCSLRAAVPFGRGDNSSFHRPNKALRSKGPRAQTPCNGGAGSVSAARALKLQRSKSLRIHRHKPELKPPRLPSPSSMQESRRFKILFAFKTTEEKLPLTRTESSEEQY